MMRWAIAALVGVAVGACVAGDYLEGVHCKSSEDCGRALECEQGFCGGCSEEGVLDNGKCGCVGDRIFDCRVLESAPYCMEVCDTRRIRCAVALVLEGNELRTIDACATLPADSSEPCFDVLEHSDLCPAEEIRVSTAELTVVAIVANCPPVDDDAVDCPEE